MTYHQKNRGFTLIELLVVIAIIGVLSGVVLQSLNTSRVKARNNIRLNQIDQIHKALEISATASGTNNLPYSGSTNDSIWVCLGNQSPCGPTGVPFYNNAVVNSVLSNGIAGGVIPKDPLFTSGVGDSYLYHSSITPSTYPEGAYLLWVVEKKSVGEIGTDESCGRGLYYQDGTNGHWCLLRIGDAVES